MKKLLATILALVMALGVTTISWADENNYVTIDGLVDGNGLIHYETLTAAAKAWRESKNVTTTGNTFGANSLGTVEEIAWTIHGTVETGDGAGVVGSNGAGDSIFGGGYFTPAVTVKRVTVKGVNNAKVAKTGDNAYRISVAAQSVVYEDITFVDTVRIDSNPANLTFNNCKFENGFRMPHSVEGANVTVNNCKLSGNANGYAVFVQGTMASFKIVDSEITNCERGMNIQAGNDAVVTIDNNTISDLTGAEKNGAKYGSAIQLTSGKTFTVTNNTISNVPVNAIHIHNLCSTDATVTISNNDITAGYLIWNEANLAQGNITSENNTCNIANPGKSLTKVKVNDEEVVEVSESTTVINVKPPRYYYNSTTTATKDEAKGSPKTFDAGVGIYALTAVLSVTGMAWTAKKRH